jgi:rfaE bifunctional protein nucleotidyltransferase chain/domain
VSARVVPDYRELAPLLAEARRGGARVALANGCFDLLHVGHVRLLREARSLADLLVVALNSDASARGHKGEGRPFMPLAERMELVAALEGVDFVTSFEEPTAAALLRTLRPDLQVKGTDWTAETVPEREVVAAYGGRVVIAGDPKTHASSDLRKRAERARSEPQASEVPTGGRRRPRRP